jgi:hypothetical protein
MYYYLVIYIWSNHPAKSGAADRGFYEKIPDQLTLPRYSAT